MTEASKEGLSLTMTTHPWNLQINFIQRAGVLSKRLSTMVTSASAAKKADIWQSYIHQEHYYAKNT